MEVKNSEGYVDMTAYQAITNTEPKRGDIWLTNTDKEVVIIQTGKKFHSVLNLLPDDGYDRIVIKSTTDMYANPMMISYLRKDNFDKFIKAMEPDEFNDLLNEVCGALDLVTILDEPVDKAEQDEKIKRMNATIRSQENQIVRYQAQRDVYKDLYFGAIKYLTRGNPDEN